MAIVQHENAPELLFARQASLSIHWYAFVASLALEELVPNLVVVHLALQVDLRRHFFKDVLETGAMLNEERRDALEAGLDGA